MKKAIYIRLPRCGSTSLMHFCKQNDLSYFGGRDMGFWGGDTILKKNTSPNLYKCISNYVGKEVYNKSFVFTTVRNPYSRAVSMYKHSSWISAKTFDDFCNAIKNNKYPHDCAKWHSSSLVEHIVWSPDLRSKFSTLKVDFVIKLESIQNDMNTVCDKLGIPHQKLFHANKSKHKHYTEYYNDETRSIVAEKYAKDIEYFNYEFGE